MFKLKVIGDYYSLETSDGTEVVCLSRNESISVEGVLTLIAMKLNSLDIDVQKNLDNEYQRGYNDGLEDANEDAYDQGYGDGYEDGLNDTRKESAVN